jgi:hypothetical protein
MQYRALHPTMSDTKYTVLASEQVLKLYKLQQVMETSSKSWLKNGVQKVSDQQSAQMSALISSDKDTVRRAIRDLEENGAFLDKDDMGALNRLYKYYMELMTIHLDPHIAKAIPGMLIASRKTA